jgi:hypothetical protein
MVKFFLADIKRKIYNPTPYPTLKRACQGNMIFQISSGNDFIIPLKKKDLDGFKEGEIGVYQPADSKR